MFIETELSEDKRPTMVVLAPGREFLLKYFDRRFNRRVTSDIEDSDGSMPVFIITGVDDVESGNTLLEECRRKDLNAVVLQIPLVIGTGMPDPMMRVAKGVARGTVLKIRDNEAVRSVIHATDVANAAFAVSQSGRSGCSYTIAAPPVKVNDLIDGFAKRIKNKSVGTIAPKWAKLLNGRSLFTFLTTSHTVDTSKFSADFPNFEFTDPVVYLFTHNYDDDSL